MERPDLSLEKNLTYLPVSDVSKICILPNYSLCEIINLASEK
jgi:hypothetical protein